ncbi:hypothetical protein ASPWEDRAFT_46712 [Aspergillus wentii DTO 134E9]|uniref:ribonuclease T1 n=1 Tax=Aspergillus wentii DTO 134E9 TaxID=1073089 RepID=A0A1L9R511_ASPWE|nr:uncharacterized protein ASPWEDRAFT_46712 [Aspergillus wentii DTO 134E9]OJJ29982.1 hypothetical protein ASPWEDRAFT_46712 [Aspergillus wentii DTO 134E9]
MTDNVIGGTTQYSKADIQRAAEAALRHHNAGTTVGDGNYPHHFGNFNNQVPLVANCAGLDLEEFPLVKSVAYPGGTPAAPRVAVSYSGANTVRLCAVMAHKRGNVFYRCDWTNDLRFEL